ncbi:MAG TPA: caspase family protein [Chitinophagaceae bacterium]|nr:caspase family protein [Chitinophagaceae bacterium]
MGSEVPVRGPGLDDEAGASETTHRKVEHYYLLVIAVDDYKGNFATLDNPVRDAGRVAQVLTQEYRFAPAEADRDQPVPTLQELDPAYSQHTEPIPAFADPGLRRTCLYNGAALKQNIIDKIEAIRKVIGKDDALLIYFAGHGIRGSNDEYYLICQDSLPKQRTTWLNITEITSEFKYTSPGGRCRDLLVVLDACFAGASTLGLGDRMPDYFSRYVLSSTLVNQTADDGPRGRGSAFADAFFHYLSENTAPYINFKDIPAPLESKFDASPLRADHSQQLFFGALPGKNGTGAFVFERLEKDKPKPADLKESFVEYLDFEEHRGTLSNLYRASTNYLNIITTHSYSYDVQKLASKITFRWLKAMGELSFTPKYCFMLEDLNIGTCTEDLWSILYRQIKEKGDTLQHTKESIHDYLFGKLVPGGEEYYGQCHVILWFYFSIGAEENFSRIDSFCAEFSLLFLKKLQGFSEEARERLGKMFLLILDEREEAKGFKPEDFKTLSAKEQINLIPINPYRKINNNHVKAWVKKAAQENLSQKIQSLSDWNRVLQMMNRTGCKEFTCKYEEFVTNLSAYCGYTKTEQDELYKELFDFKTLI